MLMWDDTYVVSSLANQLRKKMLMGIVQKLVEDDEKAEVRIGRVIKNLASQLRASIEPESGDGDQIGEMLMTIEQSADELLAMHVGQPQSVQPANQTGVLASQVVSPTTSSF